MMMKITSFVYKLETVVLLSIIKPNLTKNTENILTAILG